MLTKCSTVNTIENEIFFNFLPKKRYDFYFIYNNRHYIIEFDGIQHFHHIEFFSPTIEHYNKRRQTDITKTIHTLNQGYYIIRIAHDDINYVDDIITGCINDPEPKYRLSVSDMETYNWLLDGITSQMK